MEASGNSTVKVVLPVSRALLCSVLQAQKAVEFIQEEPSADGSQCAWPQFIAKVVASDNGEELSSLLKLFPGIPILVLRARDGPDNASVLPPSAGMGSPVSLEELPGVVLQIARGKLIVDLPGGDGDDLSDGEEPSLSPREMEVAVLLARGATNRQISATLHISPNTVKTHVGHIMSKLNTTNRTQVALLGRRILQKCLSGNSLPRIREGKVHHQEGQLALLGGLG